MTGSMKDIATIAAEAGWKASETPHEPAYLGILDIEPGDVVCAKSEPTWYGMVEADDLCLWHGKTVVVDNDYQHHGFDLCDLNRVGKARWVENEDGKIVRHDDTPSDPIEVGSVVQECRPDESDFVVGVVRSISGDVAVMEWTWRAAQDQPTSTTVNVRDLERIGRTFQVGAAS